MQRSVLKIRKEEFSCRGCVNILGKLVTCAFTFHFSFLHVYNLTARSILKELMFHRMSQEQTSNFYQS